MVKPWMALIAVDGTTFLAQQTVAPFFNLNRHQSCIAAFDFAAEHDGPQHP
jgi:hypothetical protein